MSTHNIMESVCQNRTNAHPVCGRVCLKGVGQNRTNAHPVRGRVCLKGYHSKSTHSHCEHRGTWLLASVEAWLRCVCVCVCVCACNVCV